MKRKHRKIKYKCFTHNFYGLFLFFSFSVFSVSLKTYVFFIREQALFHTHTHKLPTNIPRTREIFGIDDFSFLLILISFFIKYWVIQEYIECCFHFILLLFFFSLDFLMILTLCHSVWQFIQNWVITRAIFTDNKIFSTDYNSTNNYLF